MFNSVNEHFSEFRLKLNEKTFFTGTYNIDIIIIVLGQLYPGSKKSGLVIRWLPVQLL